MSRGITATIQNEVEQPRLEPAWLMEFHFSTVLRFWTGIGDLSWNGETWSGSGDVIKFTGIDETSAVQANGIQFQLAGMDSTLVSLALAEDVQGRAVNLYMAFVGTSDTTVYDPEGPPFGIDQYDMSDGIYVGSGGATGDLLADPVGPFQYIMDTFLIDDTPGQGAITLSAESYLASLVRPRIRRYTHEDQQIEFPGDMGLEFVASIQNIEFKWGTG